MICNLPPLIKNYGTYLPVLLIVFFLALPLSTVGVSADYLLQSARSFNHYNTSTVSDIASEDTTGDGIPDLVVVSSYSEGSTPIVTTLPGLGDGTFGEPVFSDSPLNGGNVFAMATGLFNGDQHLDLILAYKGSGDDVFGAVALLGNGDGSFTISDNLILSDETSGVVVADFTGNGITDFAVSGTYPEHKVTTFHGAGDGTFSAGGAFLVDTSPTRLTVADFDGDGDADMACGGWNQDLVIVLLNDGTGSFSTQWYFAPDDISTMATGDLNDDGFDDLVAGSSSNGGSVWINFGRASGILRPYVEYDAGDYVVGLDLGDLDHDGDLDLVVNGSVPDPSPYLLSVVTLLNNGDGSFGDPSFSFPAGRNITLADMDGDDALDAVMTVGSDFISVLLGRGDGSFVSMVAILQSEYPTSVAHADVDQDGDQDLAVSNLDNQNDAALILRNDGNGTFAEPESYYPGSDPNQLTFGDLNGDLYPELISLNRDDSNEEYVSVMFNAGDGTYGDRQDYPIGDGTAFVAAGDLDGDGDLDLAACHSENLEVLINPGNGIFGVAESYETARHARDLVLGDVDGDGDLDAAMNGFMSSVDDLTVLLFNNGDGSFGNLQQIGKYRMGATGLVLADLDGDGDLDLATGDPGEQTILVFLNNGDGNFNTVAGELSYNFGLTHLSAADLTLDGHLDLVALNGNSRDLAILRGNGDGTFGPAEMYPIGNPPQPLDLADFDGNGSLDLATCINDGEYATMVLFNTISATGLLATGPGRWEFNPTLVRIFPAASSGSPISEWPAYGADRWGVNVALGELTGSGMPEVVTGAGPGPIFGPHVRGFAIDGTPLPGVSYFAYGTNKWGVNVACGDLDNDGFDEIITGAGPGAVFGPHVRGWNWDGAGTPEPIPGISYFAYGTPRWGVNVSCGDIDGDGFDEIVTGAGPGAVYGPHVRGWNCDGGGASSIPGVSFLAYGTNKFGVNVCCGDIDGDGIDEMVTGAGPGAVFGPHVRGWNWDGSGSTQAIPAVSFFAYDYSQWGVNVSCGDLDDDGIDEILTGPGPGQDHLARVRGFNYDGQTLTPMSSVDFIAYLGAGNRYGVKVAGDRH